MTDATNDDSTLFRHVYNVTLSEIDNIRHSRGVKPYSAEFSKVLETTFRDNLAIIKKSPSLTMILKDVIINSVKEGKFIESCLEQLKELAGLAGEVLEVPTRGSEYIDFNMYNRAITRELEQCVAVASRHYTRGTLTHLTLHAVPDKFFDWYERQKMPSDARVYIIGGVKGDSDEFIDEIEQGFARRGYSIAGKETLSERGQGMHVMMYLSGVIGVTHYTRTRGADGVEDLFEHRPDTHLV